MGERVIRYGVLGLGNRGREHVAAVSRIAGLAVAGVADQEQGADPPGPPRFRTPEELVASCAPEVVVIATPPDVRASVIERCIGPSVRVMVIEKPLAPSVAEGVQVIEICERAGVLPLVGHQLRYDPGFESVTTAVASGAVGDVLSVEGWCYGDLIDQGVHLVDQFSSLLDVGSMTLEDMSLEAWLNSPGGGGTPGGTLHVRFADAEGRTASLTAGPAVERTTPDRGDWLQKRLKVAGTSGVAEARVAGWARIASTDHGDHRLLDVRDYRLATERFHRAVRDLLRDGTPHRCHASVALPTQRLVERCLAEIGTAPVARPSVSVVVPLVDERGIADRVIEGWRRESQRTGAEVILVGAPRGREDHEAEEGAGSVRYLPGREDKFADINLGALQAHGDWLAICEGHSIPRPGLLDAVRRTVTERRLDGVSFKIDPFAVNHVGRVTKRFSTAEYARMTVPDDWRQAGIDGFAMSRAAFSAAGGYRPDLHDFAERELAARLHRNGVRFAHQPDSAVGHLAARDVRSLIREFRGWGYGEQTHMMTSPGAETTRYFGLAPDAHAGDRRLARARLRLGIGAVWRSTVRGSGHAPAVADVRRSAVDVISPPRIGGVARWAAIATAAIRIHYWRRSIVRSSKAFEDLRVRSLAAGRRLSERSVLAPKVAHGGRLFIEAVPNAKTSGLYALESFDDVTFRWTRPTWGVVLRLPEEGCCLEVVLAEVRTDRHRIVEAVAVDGRRTRFARLPHGVRIHVPPGREERRLAFSVAPIRSVHADDDRLLGVPVRGFTVGERSTQTRSNLAR